MADDIFKRFRGGGRGAASGASAEVQVHRRLVAQPLVFACARQSCWPQLIGCLLARGGHEGAFRPSMTSIVQPAISSRRSQLDMVISGRMLKLVNSPFYGLRNPVASLTQAMAIIGFGSLRSLVLAAGATDALKASFIAYGFEEGGLATSAMVTFWAWRGSGIDLWPRS